MGSRHGDAAAPGNPGPYPSLAQRLDRMPNGAPEHPALERILRLLFSPEEAALAAALPTLVRVDRLARRRGTDRASLDARLDNMAARGLVLDLRHNDVRWVALAPVVIGFYEFTFMRVREDTPAAELAGLFDDYLFTDPHQRFIEAVFAGSVQLGRTLVAEEALPGPASETLDFQRASRIIADAEHIAVAACPCRTHAALLGQGCDAPVRTCMSFGSAAEALVRAGLAEPVDTAEALTLLADAKAAGLAQTADNVAGGVAYLCNCCGCCCGMMRAIRTRGVGGAIVPSDWVAAGDLHACRGCASGCVPACPTGAIVREQSDRHGARRYRARVEEDRCLGCGVCVDACRFGVRTLQRRATQPFTPASGLDRMIAMAIERGKLGALIIDTLAGVGPSGLARLLGHLEASPPGPARRAVAPLRSVFLRGVLKLLHARGRRARDHAPASGPGGVAPPAGAPGGLR